VTGWRCPRCDRLFGRSKQSHDCAPGLTLDEYFSTGPVHERPVFDAVMHHLKSVGPVHADFVSVGIFLKNPRKFAELRPMQKWVAMSFALPFRATHRTITRKVVDYDDHFWHIANVSDPRDLDGPFCDLLTEAYLGGA